MMRGIDTGEGRGATRSHVLPLLTGILLALAWTGAAWGQENAPAAPAAEKPKRPYAFIGVSMGPVSGGLADRYQLSGERRAGVLVNQVIPDSPAQKAGLRTGDIIHSIEGQPVHSPADLLEAVAYKPVGAPLALDVSRPKPGYKGSEPIHASLTPVERTDGVNVDEALDRMRNPPPGGHRGPVPVTERVGADPLAIAGLSLGPASEDGSVPGLRVFTVVPNSEAAMAGFFQGDRLLEVNARAVNNRAQILAAFDSADPKQPVHVQFIRDGKPRSVRWSLTLPLPTPTPVPPGLEGAPLYDPTNGTVSPGDVFGGVRQ